MILYSEAQELLKNSKDIQKMKTEKYFLCVEYRE